MPSNEDYMLDAKIMLRSIRNAEQLMFISVYKQKVEQQFFNYADTVIDAYKNNPSKDNSLVESTPYTSFQFVDWLFRTRYSELEKMDDKLEHEETFEEYKSILDKLLGKS